MAEFKQIIDDALDILKFDGAVQDTLAELREKWSAQVPICLLYTSQNPPILPGRTSARCSQMRRMTTLSTMLGRN